MERNRGNSFVARNRAGLLFSQLTREDGSNPRKISLEWRFKNMYNVASGWTKMAAHSERHVWCF